MNQNIFIDPSFVSTIAGINEICIEFQDNICKMKWKKMRYSTTGRKQDRRKDEENHNDPEHCVHTMHPAVSRPPAYQLPLDISIADSKEESIEQESKDDANVRVYTDGSCQGGSVGASAVLYYPQNGSLGDPVRILRCQLGSDTKYSIWDAEAAGAIMASVWLIRGSNRLDIFGKVVTGRNDYRTTRTIHRPATTTETPFLQRSSSCENIGDDFLHLVKPFRR